ncbi:DUF547 domain-containing protein [Salinisphaera sp. T31B1]|uniref:DUF547 domain-containing protein n=1 Tax=Salinisphaera sp. T31B1 TaxID=727963 RepID=UPI00333FBDB2
MRRIAIVFFGMVMMSAVQAAPEADLWSRWQAHDAQSTATIDHGVFDAFLSRYVVEHEHAPNGVRYDQVSDRDRERLDDYLKAMQAIDIDRYNRDQQRAYWINLYNAATLKVVLDAYPVDSIRDIGGGLFSSGPWKKKRLRVEDEKLSLNDIEHRILRPIWNDGMTHYGVNCASVSCPSLRAEAYTGANINAALRANARDYINSAQGVSIDNDRVTVSSLYEWYAADFGSDEQSVVSHLRQFAAPALSARLDMLDRIDAYAYDWALNDESTVARVIEQGD